LLQAPVLKNNIQRMQTISLAPREEKTIVLKLNFNGHRFKDMLHTIGIRVLFKKFHPYLKHVFLRFSN